MKPILFLMIFLFSSLAFGRAPAVDPIRGISIDDYREVDPNKDPGFNWNKGDTVVDTSLITTREPAQKALIAKTKSQNKNWPTYIFLASLITLPFVLWLSVMKGLEESERHAHQESPSGSMNLPHHDNTVDLMAERNKRESESKAKDKDVHKAS